MDSARPPVENSREMGPWRVRSAEPKSSVSPTRFRLIRKSAPPLRMFRSPSSSNPAYPRPTAMSRKTSARAAGAVTARPSPNAVAIPAQRNRVMAKTSLTATGCDQTSSLPGTAGPVQTGGCTNSATPKRRYRYRQGRPPKPSQKSIHASQGATATVTGLIRR